MEAPATNTSKDIAVAYLLLRVTIGVNICVHGISRIIGGPPAFAHSLVTLFHQTFLPEWAVFVFGLVLPWLEAIFGLLVLTGLRTRMALIAGSILLIALAFGSNLRQDWESAGLQLIYASIYAALLAFRDKNTYSLDTLLLSRQRVRK
jgi:thiosulfate dehydrogenase [quinone] large subunit